MMDLWMKSPEMKEALRQADERTFQGLMAAYENRDKVEFLRLFEGLRAATAHRGGPKPAPKARGAERPAAPGGQARPRRCCPARR